MGEHIKPLLCPEFGIQAVALPYLGTTEFVLSWLLKKKESRFKARLHWLLLSEPVHFFYTVNGCSPNPSPSSPLTPDTLPLPAHPCG